MGLLSSFTGSSAAPVAYMQPFNGLLLALLGAVYFFANTSSAYTFITGLSASLVESSGSAVPNNLGLFIIAALQGAVAYYLPHMLDPSVGYLAPPALYVVIAAAFIMSLPAVQAFIGQFYAGEFASAGVLSQNGMILNAIIYVAILYVVGSRVGVGSDA